MLLKYLPDQAGVEVILLQSTQQLLCQSGKTHDTSQVGVYRDLHKNMISPFNLTSISGDLNFSSLDRGKNWNFFGITAKASGQCWKQTQSARSQCGGREGSWAVGHHPGFGDENCTLRPVICRVAEVEGRAKNNQPKQKCKQTIRLLITGTVWEW